MTILVRRESFGFIAFDRNSRRHAFVRTSVPWEDPNDPTIRTLISQGLGQSVTDGECQSTGTLAASREGNRLTAPLCLYLEITDKCPLDCVHCYKPAGELSDSMSLADYLRLIADARQMGVFEVRLCGNEPALSPYFEEICRAVHENGMYLSLNTSGRLNQNIRELLVRLAPDHVVVSLDGNRETHDQIRALGAYDRSLSLLRMLSDHGIQRRINSVLSKLTAPFIHEVVAVARDTKSGISFIPLRTMGKKTDFKESAQLTRDEMRDCVQRITELRNEEQVPIETFFDILGDGFTAHHSMDFNTPCPAGKNGFVASTGFFYPCDWIRYLGNQFSCGDVRQEGLRRIWEGSAVLGNFQSIERVKCRDCRHYLSRCYGGCWCSYRDSMALGEYEDKLCFASVTR